MNIGRNAKATRGREEEKWKSEYRYGNSVKEYTEKTMKKKKNRGRKREITMEFVKGSAIKTREEKEKRKKIEKIKKGKKGRRI